jgi:hypothetical protein
MLARSAIMNAVRLLTALAVMLSAMSGLRAAPTFQESGAVRVVEAAAEIIIAAIDEYSHAHSHDDDCDGGPCLGHPHEHKDHSHVVFGLPTFSMSLVAPRSRSVRLHEQYRASARSPSPLDRPPCGLSVA